MKKKLSIIVLSYNCQATIKRAIDSCLNQNIIDSYEIIIIDDGSADRSIDVIKDYFKRYPDIIRYYVMDRKQNLSSDSFIPAIRASNAIKKGFSLSCGEYLSILSADDYFCDENKFNKQINYLDDNYKVVACYSDYTYLNYDGCFEKHIFSKSSSLLFWSDLYCHISSFLFRRCCLNNLLERFCDDTGMIFSILVSGKISHLEGVSFVYCNNKDGISNKYTDFEADIIELMIMQDTLCKKVIPGSFSRFWNPLRNIWKNRRLIDWPFYKKYVDSCCNQKNDILFYIWNWNKLKIWQKIKFKFVYIFTFFENKVLYFYKYIFMRLIRFLYRVFIRFLAIIKSLIKLTIKGLVRLTYFLYVCYFNLVNQNTIKVGFICQMPEVWDKTSPIFKVLQSYSNVKPYILVVPKFDNIKSDFDYSLKNNYYIDHYSNRNIIKTYKKFIGWINLRLFHFDYIFYERPYDLYLPKHLQALSLYNYTNICHVPYGFRSSPDFDKLLYNCEIFKLGKFIFCDSEEQKESILKFMKKNKITPLTKYLNFGYPSLEAYINLGKENRTLNNKILWTPRFSYDPKLGGSHYFEYKDIILDKENLGNSKLIFRPHPLMFEYFIKERKMDNRDKDEFLSLLRRNGNIYDKGDSLFSSIKESDYLITDFSSIIIDYFVTGKPIIYCPGPVKLSKNLNKIIKFIYVANDNKELVAYMKMLNSEYDPLKDKRFNFIRKNYFNYIGSNKKIADFIIKDYNSSK